MSPELSQEQGCEEEPGCSGVSVWLPQSPPESTSGFPLSPPHRQVWGGPSRWETRGPSSPIVRLLSPVYRGPVGGGKHVAVGPRASSTPIPMRVCPVPSVPEYRGTGGCLGARTRVPPQGSPAGTIHHVVSGGLRAQLAVSACPRHLLPRAAPPWPRRQHVALVPVLPSPSRAWSRAASPGPRVSASQFPKFGPAAALSW